MRVRILGTFGGLCNSSIRPAPRQTRMLRRLRAMLVSGLLSVPVMADEQLPAWELGVGVAAFSQAHYPGADDSRVFALPLPHIRYRGKWLRADRNGARLRLLEAENLSLGISGGGSFSLDSDDSDERQGMPDLDLLGEFGPSLRWQLLDNSKLGLQFQWPVRAAFSFGDDFGKFQGWTSNPRFVARMPQGKWTYTTSFGPVFSDRKYHAYIYDVAPQFVLPERPAYRSRSGYTGLLMGLNMSRYFGDFYVSGFMRYLNLAGAENSSSPLFRREHNLTAGVTVAWILQRSKKLVTIDKGDE